MRKLAVVLLTYERTDYAEETLDSTLCNLRAGDARLATDELHVHIADDGSRPEHVRALRDVVLRHGYPYTLSNSERSGYGRNYNLAMQTVHAVADYVLPLEDDWKLMRTLDVEPLLNALDASVGIECIRLGYLSFTQALFGRVMSVPPEWFKYLLLDGDSAEPHVFAGHPRLETVAFQKRVGMWPEGMAPGATEFYVAHMEQARRGIAWPMDLAPTRDPIYAHIGAVRSVDVGVPQVAHA